MKTKRLSRREFLQLSGVAIGGALFNSVLPIAIPNPISPATLSSIKLFGWVRDQIGNPIPSGIGVINEAWQELGTAQTAADGYYEVTVAGSEKVSISVNPSVGGDPQYYMDIEGGFRASRFFGPIRTILPTNSLIQVDFTLPPATALWLIAYNQAGTRMLAGDLGPRVSPPWYGPVYGIFPMDTFSLPVPTGPSIGQLGSAWHPVIASNLWEPYFATPPEESVYLMMLWPVPNIGSIPLRADNKGLGYALSSGEVRPLNIVYEFAETENRRSTEKKLSYESQGYTFSSEISTWLAQADALLVNARSQADEKDRAATSYSALELSMKAREQMAMEVAARGVEDRKAEMNIQTLDGGNNPLSGISVAYKQVHQDFILGYGAGLPCWSYTGPSIKAGKEIGFEYLYDMGQAQWSQISPAEGVFDFSKYNSGVDKTLNMGYELVIILPWFGTDNVPAWAKSLDFTDYKQNVIEFVKRSVNDLKGKVKFINLIVEPSLLTVSGSRYITADFASNYFDSMQVDDLIDLVKTVFQAAREENTGIYLGYSVTPSYNYWQLNPIPFGGKPSPYSLLKQMLESGVQPDYIGVELQHGTIQVPIDLSALSETIQAYHDLSGLPVILTEMSSYPARAEDYGVTAPAPEVYWHEGMTEKSQADWDTSVFKIAMGLPFCNGVQVVHLIPDNPDWGPSNFGGTGIGTDYLTQDWKQKKVYFAMKELFELWRGQGTVVTGSDGKVKFKGLDGDYTLTAATGDGLQQTFETHLSSTSNSAPIHLDRASAIQELQDLFTEAEMKLKFYESIGRDLDYDHLYIQLGDGKAFMVGGEYGNARILVLQILEAVRMTIDGSLADWKGIRPIATSPAGGASFSVPGTDLKALYAITDRTYLYIAVEVYDPPISLQPGTPATFPYPQFLFNITTGKGDHLHLRTYLPYGGEADVHDLDAGRIITTLYSVAHGEGLEIGVPLAILNNPGSLTITAFVIAQNNGQEMGVKGFSSDAQVITPPYDIYLPFISRNG